MRRRDFMKLVGLSVACPSLPKPKTANSKGELGVWHALCKNCRATSEHRDEFNKYGLERALEIFHKAGWKSDEHAITCPKCS